MKNEIIVFTDVETGAEVEVTLVQRLVRRREIVRCRRRRGRPPQEHGPGHQRPRIRARCDDDDGYEQDDQDDDGVNALLAGHEAEDDYNPNANGMRTPKIVCLTDGAIRRLCRQVEMCGSGHNQGLLRGNDTGTTAGKSL